MIRAEFRCTVPPPPSSSTVASADAPTVPAIKRLRRSASTPPVDAAVKYLALAELALDDLIRTWCAESAGAAS